MTGPLIPERLQHGRLSYERVTAAHAADYAALLMHPRVIPTLWPFAQPPQFADAQTSVETTAEHWERHGFGLWMVRDRDSGAIIGRAGLAWINDLPQGAAVEAGWLIHPDRWGQGLGTEVAVTSAETAFGSLGLDAVVAVTLPDNLASRRVMEKTGFRYEGDTVHAGLDHVLYRLTAEEFAQRAALRSA